MRDQTPVPSSATVVHIEADHANASLMHCLLGSKTSYALHQARDGTTGLELCRSVRPDLVITEMWLPDMTAHDLLVALRSDDATAGLPCIVLSGDAMPNHVDSALAAGFEEYWTKPIDIWRLLQKIDQAVARSWSKRRRQYGDPGATVNTHADIRLLAAL